MVIFLPISIFSKFCLKGERSIKYVSTIWFRFSHWLNNKRLHNKELVQSKWMITKGTFGLGCHASSTGCKTFYDNIKITKHIPVLLSLSLGKFDSVEIFFSYLTVRLQDVSRMNYLFLLQIIFLGSEGGHLVFKNVKS